MLTNAQISKFIDYVGKVGDVKKLNVQVRNGSFSADDVMFVALVCIEYNVNLNSINIIRSYNDSETDSENITIKNIGRIYSPYENRFDCPNDAKLSYDNGILYASSGLFLKHMKKIPEEFKKTLLERGLYVIQAEANKQMIDYNKFRNKFSFIGEFNESLDEPKGVYSFKQFEYFYTAVSTTLVVLKKILHNIAAEKMVDIHINKRIENKLEKSYIILEYPGHWKKDVKNHNEKHENDKIVMVIIPSGVQWNVELVSKSTDNEDTYVTIPESAKQIDGLIYAKYNRIVYNNKISAIKAAEEIISNNS